MMWTPRSDNIHMVVGSVGAAASCAVLTQVLSSRSAELWSETLCWAILPILLKSTHRPEAVVKAPVLSPGRRKTSPFILWFLSACLLAASLYRAEAGMVVFFPLLTPLLLAAQTYLRSKHSASGGFSMSHASPLVWSTLVALFAIQTLANGDIRGSILSIIAVAAQLLVFVSFLPRTASARYFPQIHDFENDIARLARRTVPALIISVIMQNLLFGFTMGGLTVTLTLGLFKALAWYFVAQTARHTSWCIATAIGTFALLSSRDPFLQSSHSRAASNVIASLLALAQVISMLPEKAKAKRSLWILSLVPIIPYLANLWAIRDAYTSAQLSFGSPQHPADRLVEKAKADFENMLQRQSKNYTAAHAEYVRRYAMQPPHGFEAWYEYAVSHQSPVIDDFDIIYGAVSPFWRLKGSEVISIVNDVKDTPNAELWHCERSRNSDKINCKHPYRAFDRHIRLLFNSLTKDLKGKVPNVSFLVNHLDEPRVVVPEEAESPSLGALKLGDMSGKDPWHAITQNCASQRISRRFVTPEADTLGLSFVTDSASGMNLCLHPEYKDMHGLFMSPTSFRLIEGLVPVLSTGAPSTMGDILFPSPAYTEAEFQYDEKHDVEWERKRNNLYWAGSTSGGFARDERWKGFHRQRFVQLAQNLERQTHYYLQSSGDALVRVASSFLNARLFDVAFTRIYQCETRFCRQQRAYFTGKSWADKDKALRSRLVFDTDGNGISGRYYKLLASKSAPMKQTLLKEWHDDRLVPWVHYIPVSQSLEEVPELVRYLTSTVRGQQMAEQIAEHGRAWYAKALREVDMSIYIYRLLLELARLQDPARPAAETHSAR